MQSTNSEYGSPFLAVCYVCFTFGHDCRISPPSGSHTVLSHWSCSDHYLGIYTMVKCMILIHISNVCMYHHKTNDLQNENIFGFMGLINLNNDLIVIK